MSECFFFTSLWPTRVFVLERLAFRSIRMYVRHSSSCCWVRLCRHFCCWELSGTPSSSKPTSADCAAQSAGPWRPVLHQCLPNAPGKGTQAGVRPLQRDMVSSSEPSGHGWLGPQQLSTSAAPQVGVERGETPLDLGAGEIVSRVEPLQMWLLKERLPSYLAPHRATARDLEQLGVG